MPVVFPRCLSVFNRHFFPVTRLRDLDFEWDEAKAAANLAKHGIGFSTAELVFRARSFVEFDVTRAGDGEARFKRVGLVGTRLLTVVFTLRGGRIRLISLRAANAGEKVKYGNRSIHT